MGGTGSNSNINSTNNNNNVKANNDDCNNNDNKNDVQWLVDARNNGEWETIFLKGTKILSNVNSRKSIQRIPENYAYLLEDVFIASLIYGRFDWSKWCHLSLSKMFPTDETFSRLKLLEVMSCEALGEWETVNQKCERYLALTNDIDVKRRLIVSKINQGMILDAIQLLNRFLKEHAEDGEAWKQLAGIYILVRRLKYALYCYQETILLKPTDFHSLVSCGELHYSLGEFSTSKDYYAFALILDDKSPRALWGIIMAITAKGNKSSSGKSGNRSNSGGKSVSAAKLNIDPADEKILTKAISKLKILNETQTGTLWKFAVLNFTALTREPPK